MTLHAVVGARVTLGAQQLEQPPRSQPLARRTPAVRPQQSIKLRDISPQSRLRLNPPLVAKLDRRTPDRLAHRLPRDPQLANDLADRLFLSTQNARLIRPIVSTVTIPGQLPQAPPGRASDDSGGGSLLDADHPQSRVTLPRCFPRTRAQRLQRRFRLGRAATR